MARLTLKCQRLVGALFVLLMVSWAAGCTAAAPTGANGRAESTRTDPAPPLIAAPATASVVSAAGASDIAGAVENVSGFFTSSEIVSTPGPTALAVSDTPLAGFPTAGDTYAVLSSGNAADIALPNDSPNLGTDLGGGSIRGDTDFDVSVVRLDFTAPEGANCLLGLDFRFLTEEFPEYVGSSFNDAFIVELDESTWTTSASDVIAPGNIAFDPLGNEISVNAAGATSLSEAQAAGTTFDGATAVLEVATPLSPGGHSLFFSIFDQGDSIYDSAVLVDNMRIGAVVDPETDCVPGAVVAPPSASFTATPDTGDAPLDVGFDASSSSNPNGPIASYEWDFGNGETGSGITASTTYDTPGDYTVSLTVSDGAGQDDTAVQVISVTSGPVENLAPTASFAATPDTGEAPLAVEVDASSSGDADGTIASYAWDFGNGETGSGITASTTYDTPGEYTLTLTVTDDDGATDTETTTIVVDAADPSIAGDAVSITISGAVSYVAADSATSGDIVITEDALGVSRVAGTVALDGPSGGSATVSIDAQRFLWFPVYVGSVKVSDPAAGVVGEFPIIFRPLGASGSPLTVSSDSPWVLFTPPFSFDPLLLEWSVTDVEL